MNERAAYQVLVFANKALSVQSPVNQELKAGRWVRWSGRVVNPRSVLVDQVQLAENDVRRA